MIPGEGAAANFLLDASRLYKETCPELSRFFMQYAVKSNETSKKRFSILSNNMLVCPSCHQFLHPDNHRVRLRPKQRPPARVQSVLRRKARGKRLSLVQQDLLHRFQKSSSVLMATCHTCNTTSRHKGMNREFLTTLAKTHSTPGSGSKHKTPQSTSRPNMTTPKTPGKDKTPAHTPSYEKPPPGFIKEHEDKPEDCIPAEPGNEEARSFLAHAPTRGLWMPLGKEVKVMQCWRCKRYGHRTGDRECPFFIKGNQKLEQFRVAHEDPMYDVIRENKRNEKETRFVH
ncbi:Retinitis pigmentosa 9 protein-like protein [Nibea albiflora]|uniref:Retinitis pigmentosa 9 protein-like protein n=1 Tax=Nibea albiflora TaxID=240163 RepID=A0ACB7ET09_NIBAL|nr:Retinitis pigmentosa 9 protein-like protein [Nibea albiflora]